MPGRTTVAKRTPGRLQVPALITQPTVRHGAYQEASMPAASGPGLERFRNPFGKKGGESSEAVAERKAGWIRRSLIAAGPSLVHQLRWTPILLKGNAAADLEGGKHAVRAHRFMAQPTVLIGKRGAPYSRRAARESTG